MSDEQNTQTTNTDNTGGAAGGTLSPFHESLPEDLRAHESLKGIADAPSLAKAFVDLKTSLPQVPEAYQFDFGDKADKVDKTAHESFTAAAKELGLTQAQYEAIVKFDMERAGRYETEFNAAVEAARKDAETKLRDTWKAEYDRNRDVASRGLRTVIKALGDNALESRLAAKGFMDDPDVMLMFHKIGAATSEDTFIPNTRQTTGMPRTSDGMPLFDYPNSPELRR